MPTTADNDAAAISLAEAIDAALPQTQCTRCGYPDCRSYAEAIAFSGANINQCPPGGQQGIERLAAVTGREPLPLNPANGSAGPLRLAVIDEAQCIGCTLCIQACPVDCIAGASKRMHTVIDELCTGCELCLPACPVDCIAMTDTGSDLTGWDAWSAAQADQARSRYVFHRQRLDLARQENEERLAAQSASRSGADAVGPMSGAMQSGQPKSSLIEAAMARARDLKSN